MSLLKKSMIGGVLLLLLLGALAGGALFAVNNYMQSPLAALDESATLMVNDGDTLYGVADRLAGAGLLEWPQVFVAWGRYSGFAARIQAGEYELEPGMTPAGVLLQLVDGRVKLYSFTILEGWTLKEILLSMAEHPAITLTIDPQDIPADVVLEDELTADTPAEGWFYPETYHIPRNTTDKALLRQASKLMLEQLAAAWDSREDGLPLNSPYEMLTLASIVERETAVDAERDQVAGVFIRRLRKGMRLQTDPTVIYGTGDAYDGNITRRHLTTDTPYNTYTRYGLPPTPIGMASAASLRAAGHPDDGSSLYFVASPAGDGSHVFSDTLIQHNRAVQEYLAALRRARQSGNQ